MYDRLTPQHFVQMAQALSTLSLSKPRRIVAEVAAKNDIGFHTLLSSNRTHKVAHARQEAMLRLRRETDLSLPQIGRIFKRDHSTVIHGIRRASQREAI